MIRQGRQARLVQDGGSPECLVDRQALQQVFRNLLENSLQACSDPVEIKATWTERIRKASRDSAYLWPTTALV